MTRALLFVGRRLLAGVLAAHLAGILLFGLVVAVEGVELPLPTLGRLLSARVPALWAQSAAVLGCVGVAGGATALRRSGALLALGTFGFDPRVLLVLGALLAGVGGALAERTAAAPAPVPGAWERGAGGWIRDGEAWPDVPGVQVRRSESWGRGPILAGLGAAGAGGGGAALGLWGGAAGVVVVSATMLVVDVVARGLAERGALPGFVDLAPGLFGVLVAIILLSRAPPAPRRHG